MGILTPFLKILVSGAILLGGVSRAYSAGACQSLITSWLGFDSPPQLSLEQSFDDLFRHLDVGSLEESEAGQLQIKSGVHTFSALQRILHSHGLRSPSLRSKNTTTEPVAGKSVRMEALSNGVLRIQLGVDLWISEFARDNARVTVAPEQTYRGIKTLFPRDWDAATLRDLMMDFYSHIYEKATAEEITSSHHSVEECFQPSNSDLLPIKLKMVLVYGRPVSFFPTWIQESCY